MGKMRLVFLLGVLSILALSSTADTETSLSALNREVRQAGKGAQGRLKRGSKKGNGRKGKNGKKPSKANRLKGKRRKDGKGRKSAKGKGKKQKRRRGNKSKGGKGTKKKGIKRQNPKKQKTQKNLRNEQTCINFFTATNARDLRYAQNQQRKEKRIERFIARLDKKRDKSATAFSEAAEFFRDCPAASPIFNVLSQCDVTARNLCNSSIFFEQNPQYKTLLDSNCTAILSTTVDSGKKCIDKCPEDKDDECNYIGVPRNNYGERECNFIEFEEDLKTFEDKCLDPDIVGSFTNCNSLLKKSYGTAITCCSTTTQPTTTKNPAGALLKLRKFNDFKSWKLNL